MTQEQRNPSRSGGRLRSIDFLRGSASLAILLLHISRSGIVPNPPLWFSAIHRVFGELWWGVPLFFVISGFCIHLQWASRRAKTGSQELGFWNFWKRRMHRLYPPYFLALCCSMLTVYVAYRMGYQLPLVNKYPSPVVRSMLYDFFLHATMLHGFSRTYDMGAGNVNLWSLAREEYFYLMYFALMFARRRWGLWIPVAAVLVLGLGMNFGFSGNPQWGEFIAGSALVLWFQWTLGMVAAEAYCGLVRLPRWCSSGALAAVWFAIAIVCRSHYNVLAPFAGGMAFFLLVNYCIKLDVGGRWRVNWFTAWLQRVGIFSYSLYLVHNPIRAVLKQVLRPISYTTNPFLYWLVSAVLGLGGYWGGKLYYRVVESRFLNSSREVAHQRSVLAAPASGKS